jgi:uncharacterized repeat protein (TIGR02543 family)
MISNHVDWRLPTLTELGNIYGNKPFINYLNGSEYWSSEAADISGSHYYFNLSSGKVNSNDDNSQYSVRCVRSTSYKITLDAKGGIVSPTKIIVDSGKTLSQLSIPVPIKGSYVFDCWSVDSATCIEDPENYVIIKDLTLYAKWGPEDRNPP